MPDAATTSGADGMAVDADGRVYIVTTLGVQIFDQIGKCHAIRGTSNVEFGGRNLDELWVTIGDKVVQTENESERRSVVEAAGEAGAATPLGVCG